MNLVTVREIYRSREAYLDKEIQIGGWVRSVRGSKAFGFVVVSDGSYFETLQIVYHDTLENFSDISKLLSLIHISCSSMFCSNSRRSVLLTLTASIICFV